MKGVGALWFKVRPRLKEIYLWSKYRLKLIVTYVCIKTFFLFRNKRIGVILDTRKLYDGTGAQIQRILSTYLIASVFKIGYLHSGVATVQVHPLDPFQDLESLSEYIDKLNQEFVLPSSSYDFKPYEIIEITSLTLFELIRYKVLSTLTKRKYLLKFVDPYPVSEYLVSEYWRVLEALPENSLAINKSPKKDYLNVVIHHRQGVGGQVIYPGQSIPRELHIDYFLDILSKITTSVDKSLLRISIHTDAPAIDLVYVPNKEQLHLWDGTPNFENGQVQIRSSKIDQVIGAAGYKAAIQYGGDPLDTIRDMASADYLIMARSSLSYVGGILNQHGTVYAAPDFWHKSLPIWKHQ
jgi:hypothetical protein